jgi:hypothetical protein
MKFQERERSALPTFASFFIEVGSVTGIGDVVSSRNRRVALCNLGIDRVESTVVIIDIFHCCQGE